ncbi:hypothetical protein JRQ81_009625 [Phrynocephalus forsythii]|uniref:Uncharacterized protein n=1 Tax=Phrynocephalus forsythii TaxID=171643 RepID=A0A9Q1B7K6_9SAUR|nr:hypothetical protein JRQ81_009625 [Phrynocephalus forsythii]
MATSFQPYKRSTFPPLLESYLPVSCRNQNGSNQQKADMNNKRKMKNNSQALSEERKEELIKQSLQEQHYLETYKNLYKLRNILCERYRTLLNEKVQKQRRQIQWFNLSLPTQLKNKAKKPIPSHKVPFCKVSHNMKYLESIPQSSSYLIIGLQNELTKLGIIKNQQDYEDFWNLAQESISGSKLKEKLPHIKAKMFAAKSVFLSTSARANPPQLVNGSANNVRLKQFSCQNTALLLQSADTCQPSAHYMSQQMSSQEETEQIFPKFLSWLSEVQKRHGEPYKTQQGVTSSANLPQNKTYKRRVKGEQHLHRLHHMHYFSLVNAALSKRLLEQNGQFSEIRREEYVHDLVEYLFPNEHKGSIKTQTKKIIEEKIIEEKRVPSSGGIKQLKRHHKVSSKTQRVEKEKEMISLERDLAEIAEEEKFNTATFGQHRLTPVPLTLEDVAFYNPVVECKTSGNYWINYVDSDFISNNKNY